MPALVWCVPVRYTGAVATRKGCLGLTGFALGGLPRPSPHNGDGQWPISCRADQLQAHTRCPITGRGEASSPPIFFSFGIVPHTIYWVDFLVRDVGLSMNMAGWHWSVVGLSAFLGPLVTAALLPHRYIGDAADCIRPAGLRRWWTGRARGRCCPVALVHALWRAARLARCSRAGARDGKSERHAADDAGHHSRERLWRGGRRTGDAPYSSSRTISCSSWEASRCSSAPSSPCRGVCPARTPAAQCRADGRPP